MVKASQGWWDRVGCCRDGDEEVGIGGRMGGWVERGWLPSTRRVDGFGKTLGCILCWICFLY